jgi:hypothetical protein
VEPAQKAKGGFAPQSKTYALECLVPKSGQSLIQIMYNPHPAFVSARNPLCLLWRAQIIQVVNLPAATAPRIGLL